MKARLINLKTLDSGEADLKVDYRALLQEQLNRIDKNVGLGIAEIEKRLEMRASLKSAGDTWLIKEEWFTDIKGLLSSERWAIVSENLVTFVKDVNGASEVDVTAKDELDLAKGA